MISLCRICVLSYDVVYLESKKRGARVATVDGHLVITSDRETDD